MRKPNEVPLTLSGNELATPNASLCDMLLNEYSHVRIGRVVAGGVATTAVHGNVYVSVEADGDTWWHLYKTNETYGTMLGYSPKYKKPHSRRLITVQSFRPRGLIGRNLGVLLNGSSLDIPPLKSGELGPDTVSSGVAGFDASVCYSICDHPIVLGECVPKECSESLNVRHAVFLAAGMQNIRAGNCLLDRVVLYKGLVRPVPCDYATRGEVIKRASDLSYGIPFAKIKQLAAEGRSDVIRDLLSEEFANNVAIAVLRGDA
jgi:hypothetical protein